MDDSISVYLIFVKLLDMLSIHYKVLLTKILIDHIDYYIVWFIDQKYQNKLNINQSSKHYNMSKFDIVQIFICIISMHDFIHNVRTCIWQSKFGMSRKEYGDSVKDAIK